jgi:catecholate siderophore receptor
VPAHTATLWNKYQFTPMWAAGLGMIYQGSSPTGADNTVYLPGFTRFDGAVYANINENLRAQLNVQNLLNREYYVNAHSNNNITPGAPRTVMLTLTSDF